MALVTVHGPFLDVVSEPVPQSPLSLSNIELFGSFELGAFRLGGNPSEFDCSFTALAKEGKMPGGSNGGHLGRISCHWFLRSRFHAGALVPSKL